MAKQPTSSMVPPLPGGPDDHARRQHTALRLRMLTGGWFDDLIQHAAQHFGRQRQRFTGKPDLSTNVILSVVEQLSQLYPEPPAIRNTDDDDDTIAPVLLLFDGAGWWAKASRNQRYTLGLRECFVRPSWNDDGTVAFRIVPPCWTYAEWAPGEPDQPHYVVEARRRVYGKDEIWTQDIVDLRDPSNPTYQIQGQVKGDAWSDLTEHYAGRRMDGPAYPYRASDGTPIMPYILYHAELTDDGFDPYNGREMVEGTLTIAVLWTFWLHCCRDAAWAQKWTLDAVLRGKTSSGEGHEGSSYVETDPISVMQFTSAGTGTASLGQWNPAIDPETLGRAIHAFESRLGVYYGVGETDLVQTSDSSGYALSIRRSAVREAQRSYEPAFRRADTLLIRFVAILANRFGGMNVPEDGYTITYRQLPLSLEETKAQLEEHSELMAAGLASLVDVYIQRHPGVTREQAAEELSQIKRENMMLGSLPAMGAGPAR